MSAAAAPSLPEGSGLRILLLAPQPFLEVRGTPLAVLAMVRALVAQGHHVDLLTFPQGADVALPGLVHRRSLKLPVGRVGPGASLAKLALDVPFMAEAVWRMAGRRYDVVHAVEEAAHLAAPFTRLFRVPLVVDIDSSIPDQLRESGFARRGPLPWLAGALEGHALRHAAAVITVCASLTDGVRARVPAARVFQVEDPPLVEGEPPRPADVAALGSALGLDARPVVLYSGNFEEYQGVDLLVDAAARVREAQFVFMGGEPGEVAAARGRADARGAARQCVFAGKRPPSELPLFLALAALVASPRRRGVNTPFKVYTYLASGRPLLATRILSHTQLLDEGNAWLVEPTAEALAAGIRAILADAPEAARRAARARALVDREYSPARYADKVREAYGAVMVSARHPERRDILPPVTARAVPPNPQRVLVVEDSEDSAEILGELLRRWGHDVRLAHDGATAVQVAREFRPQVILLDIGLPDVDGYTVADRLRGEGLAGDLLVALTGYGPEEDRERARQAGFDRHLMKPVDPNALLDLFRASSASGAA